VFFKLILAIVWFLVIFHLLELLMWFW